MHRDRGTSTPRNPPGRGSRRARSRRRPSGHRDASSATTSTRVSLRVPVTTCRARRIANARKISKRPARKGRGRGRRVFARSALARERARVATLGARCASARRERSTTRRRSRSTDSGPRSQPKTETVRYEGALESSGAVAVLRARRVFATAAVRRDARGGESPRRRRPTRRRGRRSSRRPAPAARTDRARRLREPPPWQRRLRRPRSRRTLAGTPEAARRSRATARHRKPRRRRRWRRRVGGRRVQSGPGSARARCTPRSAASSRRSRSHDGSRGRGTPRRLARALRRRVWRGRPGAPRRGAGRRRVSGAVRGFQQDGGVALGAGPAFGSGAAAASAAPEPERHLPPIACIDEGSRATPANLSDPVPERRRGAGRGDGDADGFAFSRFPELTRAAVWRRRIRKSPWRRGVSERARRGEAGERLERAREDTREVPGGRTPRGWAL